MSTTSRCRTIGSCTPELLVIWKPGLVGVDRPWLCPGLAMDDLVRLSHFSEAVHWGRKLSNSRRSLGSASRAIRKVLVVLTAPRRSVDVWWTCHGRLMDGVVYPYRSAERESVAEVGRRMSLAGSIGCPPQPFVEGSCAVIGLEHP